MTEPTDDTCRIMEVDGETVLLRGDGELSEWDRQFAAEIVRAAKRRYQAEHSPADDSRTTPATTCSAQRRVAFEAEPRQCIRAAHHTGISHTDDQGYRWSDTVAVYPLADNTVKVGPSGPRPAEEIEDERAVREHWATDEDAQSTARRAALRAFVEGVRLGVSFSNEEEETFAAHLETEFREADAARAEAKRQEAMGLSGMRAAKTLLERRTTTLSTRAEQAEELLRIAHETSNRSEAERAQVQAAAERVRERCQAVRDRVGPGGMINATQILGLLSPTWPDGNYEASAPGAALNATEQPTTEG